MDNPLDLIWEGDRYQDRDGTIWRVEQVMAVNGNERVALVAESGPKLGRRQNWFAVCLATMTKLIDLN